MGVGRRLMWTGFVFSDFFLVFVCFALFSFRLHFSSSFLQQRARLPCRVVSCVRGSVGLRLLTAEGRGLID
ncbi:hypothetical protein JOL62DRAFT_577189 [Phyllosticta paracitricarpa]|uniref:Secreted protein n=1 Tax=Phyllosticta paracitricarpa TaxID=2016321 RepID=A0ABR1N452_9PEZI